MAEEEREKEPKVYAHVYQLLFTASEAMRDYIDCYRRKIDRIDLSKNAIFCSNGDVHYFMNESQYKQWCIGRNYVLHGKSYRSGMELTPINLRKIDNFNL